MCLICAIKKHAIKNTKRNFKWQHVIYASDGWTKWGRTFHFIVPIFLLISGWIQTSLICILAFVLHNTHRTTCVQSEGPGCFGVLAFDVSKPLWLVQRWVLRLIWCRLLFWKSQQSVANYCLNTFFSLPWQISQGQTFFFFFFFH